MASSGVCGIGDDQIKAFTNFGIENLTELIRTHEEDPELSTTCGIGEPLSASNSG